MRLTLVRAAALVGAVPLALSTAGASAAADDPPRRWRPPEEARLPEGFPAPAEPGRVLVKWYPSVRGASVRVDGDYRLASYRAFWPLFRHIESAGIEMTAPVVSDYGEDVRTEGRGTMRMAFLYPSASAGRPASVGSSDVRVFDSVPLCVVSVGVEGSYGLASMREAVAILDRWLEENAGTWRSAGAPRRLSYQQPLPFKRLYSEVQIPIAPQSLGP